MDSNCFKCKKSTWHDRGPGPAAYVVPPLIGYKDHDITKHINPAYTMRPKCPIDPKTVGPGPAYLVCCGQKARDRIPRPAFSIRAKRKEGSNQAAMPGPGNYDAPNTNSYRYRWPSHTIVGRYKSGSSYVTPGPNAYILPPLIGPKIINKLAGPAVTIRGRIPEKIIGCSTDNPCVYYTPEPLKATGPAFSMRNRLHDTLKTYPCGPGSHDIGKVRRYPSYSFGIKHSEFVYPVLTECDKSSYYPLDSY